MAIAEVFIPDGKFCSDEEHLGCQFEKHMEGFHWCGLYHESIGKLQDIYVNGEHQRSFYKCQKCIEKCVMMVVKVLRRTKYELSESYKNLGTYM